jgi:hypothetical protein
MISHELPKASFWELQCEHHQVPYIFVPEEVRHFANSSYWPGSCVQEVNIVAKKKNKKIKK